MQMDMQDSKLIHDVPLEIVNEHALKLPQTKQHEGVTLQWSPVHNAYQFPLPNPGKVAIILNEETGQFVPAFSDSATLIYEEKTAEKDGVSFTQKRVYQPEGITYSISDVEQLRLKLNVSVLECQVSIIEAITGARHLLKLAIAGVVIAGGVSLAIGFYGMAHVIGEQAAIAVAEISYYAVWILGGIIAAFALRFLWPLLTKRRHGTEYEFEAAVPIQEAQQAINININQAAATGAQQLINNR